MIGETGCGKTVTALSVLSPSPGEIEKGEELFQKEDGEAINLLAQKGKVFTGDKGDGDYDDISRA